MRALESIDKQTEELVQVYMQQQRSARLAARSATYSAKQPRDLIKDSVVAILYTNDQIKSIVRGAVMEVANHTPDVNGKKTLARQSANEIIFHMMRQMRSDVFELKKKLRRVALELNARGVSAGAKELALQRVKLSELKAQDSLGRTHKMASEFLRRHFRQVLLCFYNDALITWHIENGYGSFQIKHENPMHRYHNLVINVAGL